MEPHREVYYFNALVGPIVAIGAAGLISLCIYWISECSSCCPSTRTQQQDTEYDICEKECVCEICNAWKCKQRDCSCKACHPKTRWESDCCWCHNCCKRIIWLVSEIVKLMLGDEFYLIKEQKEQSGVDESGRIIMYIGERQVHPKSKCLNIFLGSMAIALMTFLAMVFADIFFVKSYPGCQPGLNCYENDNKFHERPIDNCSDYLRLNIPTICYSLELSFQPAFSAVGGILIMSRLLVVGFAKLMISCTSKFLRSKHCSSKCSITLVQCIVAGVFLLIAGGILTGTTLKSNDKPTQFRLAGYIIQYITVGVSVCLAIVAPWYLLIRCQCDQPSPKSTAASEIRLSTLNVVTNPIPNPNPNPETENSELNPLLKNR